MQRYSYLLNRALSRRGAMTTLFVGPVLMLLFLCLGSFAAPRPNIVIIMADDMGFSDLGCYGSEIATPNLDRLAAGGLRFTQFENTAKCHSSRVSLMTGRYCYQAGDVKLTHAVTAAEVLGKAGYFTAMTGKWHLDKQPTDFGFDRYFGHLSGACSYYLGDNSFRLNGQAWKVPAQGFYTTIANIDFALKFLGEARAEKKPWFLYVAFNAPHAPLQPLEKDYKKYLGRYDAGWDVVRAARIRKQAQMGLFGKTVEPCPRPEHIPAWDSLGSEVRKYESRRMAAYAGLIDRVDQEVGRLVDNLQKAGELENTLIFFCSDNGACPFDRRQIGSDEEPYDPEVRWSDSTGWAWMRNSPFRFYKQNQFEGGISSPGIVHWPAGLKAKPGSFCHEPAHLIDVLPTVAEVAGASLPTQWPGRELEPVSGISLGSVLAGKTLGQRPPIHLLFGTDRGLRDGDWKLVSFRSNPWELYNIAQDRTELHNLAAQKPEILERMVKLWHDMAEQVLHAPAKARGPVLETAQPVLNPQWSNYSGEDRASAKGKAQGKAKAKGKSGGVSTIRARKETALTIEGNQLVITCNGTDSGLAMDQLPDLKPGPYKLTCRLQSQAGGEGEVFFTTDGQTTLPQGTRVPFPVTHDGQWHELSLVLKTDKPLYGLRFDPCSSPGVVRVESLRLLSQDGEVLHAWPAQNSPADSSRRARKKAK